MLTAPRHGHADDFCACAPASPEARDTKCRKNCLFKLLPLESSPALNLQSIDIRHEAFDMTLDIKNIGAILCAGGLLTACASTEENPGIPQLACPATHTAPVTLPLPTSRNSIGMEFVGIPPGTFVMGSHEREKSRHDELPRHCVRINRAFHLGKYEVTQAQWQAVMEENPSAYQAPEHPVENVSWEDAQRFIQRLNQKEKTDKYRLPTEAEWEYAARAGTSSVFSFGGKRLAPEHACLYTFKTGNFTCPAGEKKPNPWGLYDMHGNVWEWVQDWYDPGYYASSPAADPRGPASGNLRVLRGGGWHSTLSLARSAVRGNHPPDYRDNRSGFRIAFTTP
jgi:formylglycine-generating enzyme required for sulfatase activity